MAVADLLPSRYTALAGAITVTVFASMAALFDSRWLFLAGAAGALSLIGVRDYFQTRHAILRNYPLLAHFRFFFESIRPEIRQYLLEGDNEAVPFSRLATSKSFDPQPGNDAHIIVGREHALKELRREEMRA